jgi:transcriptional regulator with XRE-family HTH domain
VEDERRAFGLYLRDLRAATGQSQETLARAAHCSQGTVSHAEGGHSVPEDKIAASIDKELGAEGRYLEAVQRERIRRQLEQIGVPQPDAPTIKNGQKVSRTDRRAFLAATALAAAMVSRQIAGSDPDPLTLDDMEADVHGITAGYLTTPHAELEPRVAAGWQSADNLLSTRLTLAARRRVTTVAGQYAYYLGRLGFNTGNDSVARTFSVLASQYANDVGDPLLIGAVAGLRSSLAYYAGQYSKAADLAAAGRAAGHPASHGRLAAFESRALAAGGHRDTAEAALVAMRNAPTSTVPTLGDAWNDHEGDAFVGVAYSRLGDGVTAEGYVRATLARIDTATAGAEYVGNMLTALAQAMLQRERAEPEEAARLGGQALDILTDYPTRTVAQRATEIAGNLARFPELAATVEYRERLESVPVRTLTGT